MSLHKRKIRTPVGFVILLYAGPTEVSTTAEVAMKDRKLGRWKDEIDRRVTANRKEIDDLTYRIESKIDRLVSHADATRMNNRKASRISKQLYRLSRIVASDTADVRTLEHVEDEVDYIFAEVMDQEMTLDEAEDESDETYGDQSENDTYYEEKPRSASRDWDDYVYRRGSTPRTRRRFEDLDEAEDEADDVYGDQSDNDTYYH